jgi:hypothetical protein
MTSSERAALSYQHEARDADQRITDAIDSHVQAERPGRRWPGRGVRSRWLTARYLYGGRERP